MAPRTFFLPRPALLLLLLARSSSSSYSAKLSPVLPSLPSPSTPPVVHSLSCCVHACGSASARAHRTLMATATARPLPVVARRMLSSVRCSAAVPTSVPVRVAFEMQQAGHRYLDVRTEDEFSAGHPAGALNIPYMHKTGSGRAKNSRFVEQVLAILGKDDKIIVGCQSGKRSLMAAAELCSAGFATVTDIAGGFSAWKENGLPISP